MDASTRGLVNLGNTCYINTVLQCLLRCRPFVRYIVNAQKTHTGDGFLDSFADVVLELMMPLGDDGRPLRPFNPRMMIRQMQQNPLVYLQLHEPNDVTEFLACLLECLNKACRPVRHVWTENKSFLDKMQSHWYDDVGKDYTPLKDIFYGQMVSQVTCGMCRSLQHNFETYLTLMLPVASVTQSSSFDESIKLTELLKRFFDEDKKLDGVWTGCDSCKKNNRSVLASPAATKVSRLSKLPQVLTIALGRFTSPTTKIDVHVDACMDDVLDMSPYIVRQLMDKNECLEYRLMAIACHSGSLRNGHYWAYVRSEKTNTWTHIDDTLCVARNNQGIPTPREAYMFFYVRSG
jgi:ubiquitin C-terminal hydrolase